MFLRGGLLLSLSFLLCSSFQRVAAADSPLREILERRRAIATISLSEDVDLTFFPAFLRHLHESLSDSQKALQYDLRYFSVEHDAQGEELRKLKNRMVSTGFIFEILGSKAIWDKTSLLLVDGAYFSYLTHVRGLDHEEATKKSRQAALAAKDTFKHFKDETFIQSIHNRDEIISTYGIVVKQFIEEKIPAYADQSYLDLLGGSLQEILIALGKWKLQRQKSFDLAKHTLDGIKPECNLKLKKVSKY
ncbi:MAG: hypothetical protein JWQ35_1199 [Bacteriovoracaceae bacterium]|nr:hypothetical protein [Bacteriovoracaceae bacterium]